MVGVAPAANTPQAFEGSKTVATIHDATSGHENADTAVALPPEMVKALGEMTMMSAQEPENVAAPMTMRMGEAPRKAAIPLPSGAPSPLAPRRSSPSIPPPLGATRAASGTGGKQGATTLAPPTDPMAVPVPLERKPLVTTHALSPIAIDAIEALEAPAETTQVDAVQDVGPANSQAGVPTRVVAAVIEPDVSELIVVAPVVDAPAPLAAPAAAAPPAMVPAVVVAPLDLAPAAAPVPASPAPMRTIGPGHRGLTARPSYASAPPAAGTIHGMPLVADAPSPAPSPLPVPEPMPRHDETMVLAPTKAPVAPTVSMPPMPPAMPAGMSQVSQSSRAAIPAAPQRSAPPQANPSPPQHHGPAAPQYSLAPQHHPHSLTPLQPSQQQQQPLQHPPPAPFAPVAWPPPLPNHPQLVDTRSPSDDQPVPLTYQVYNPASSPTGRPPALSRMSMPEASPPKGSLGLRVGLVVLGICVVAGTAGAVILSGSDDPPKSARPPTPSASVAVAISAAPLPAVPPPVAPPVVIGDPTPVPPTATAAAKPAASGKTKPAGGAALKGAKIPPNPFGGGGGTLPSKRK